MQDHATDPGVFIRSMATRGHLGGLALATPQAVRILDAAGTPWVLVETVGVGQVEVEVAAATDTVVVVLNPGWGDAVQANKAGLLEIADVFVLNKADRAGVDDTERDIRQMLELGGARAWEPPVLRAVATAGTGVAEVWDAVVAHRTYLESGGELAARRRARLRDEIRAIALARYARRVDDQLAGPGFAALMAQVDGRTLDPFAAASRLTAGPDGGRGSA
jgi:LAO/AO transport system kinase